MTLIEFTFDGNGAPTASKAFQLKHSYKFNGLRLKHIIYYIANENLVQSWPSATSGVSAPDRTMYAPLYLDVSGFTGSEDHHSYSSSMTDTDTQGLISFGSAMHEEGYGYTGTREDVIDMNLDLINNTETEWKKDETLTLTVKYSSVETPGTFADPAAFTSAEWDKSCRITVVFELLGMETFTDATNNIHRVY